LLRAATVARPPPPSVAAWLRRRVSAYTHGTTGLAGMKVQAVWGRMSGAFRDAAVADLAAIRTLPEAPPWFNDLVADLIGFRRSTVRRADDAQFAQLLRLAIPRADSGQFGPLLVLAHMQRRKDLVGALYDELRIPHEGVSLPESAGPPTLEPRQMLDAASSLIEKGRAVEDVLLCVAVIADAGIQGWRRAAADACDKLLQRLAADPAKAPPPQAPADLPDADAESLDPDLRKQDIGFSALDWLLLRAMVSAVNEVEGSLPLEGLDDVIQEIVELNDGRTKSYFHRGFLDALLSRQPSGQGAGENADRRSWYLAGYLYGWKRREPDERVLERLDALSEPDRKVLNEGEPPPGGLALVAWLARALLDAGRMEDATRWLRRYVARAPGVIPDVVAWAREAHFDREPAVVSAVLEVIDSQLSGTGAGHPPVPPRRRDSVRHHLAISWRRQRRFDQARRKLEQIIGDTDAVHHQRYRFELAMITMGLGALEDLKHPDDDRRATFLAALERARSDLEAAAAPPRPHPGALLTLALPVIADLGAGADAVDEARRRLAQAVEDMVKDGRSFWQRTGLRDRASFYAAVLDLRTLEQSLVDAATRSIHDLLVRGFDAPIGLLVDVIRNSMLAEAPHAIDITQIVLDRDFRRGVADLEIETLARHPVFVTRLLEKLDEVGDALAAKLRWDTLVRLLRGMLQSPDRDEERARHLLDRLEVLARERDEFSRALLELLDAPELKDIPWSDQERREAQVVLAERVGDRDVAEARLVELTHRAISDRDEQAADMLERLERLGAGSDTTNRLRARLESAMPQATRVAEAVPLAVDDRSVRVLFIGGNETQEAYRDQVVQAVRRSYPNAQVFFEFTGWGSSWGRELDRYQQRIPRMNAVVLMRFVRTQLGRSIRRLCGQHNVPWIPCTGHGRDSMTRATLRAIRVATGPRA
jgi:hypothetical protein